jgi:hypothetical protein
MKSFLLSVGFCFLVQFSFGQGNLQFNQVLTYSGEFLANDESPQTSAVYTVPANKVWKIEFLSNPLRGPENGPRPVINGKSLYVDPGSNPIWLKTGNTIQYEALGAATYAAYSDPKYKPYRSWLVSIIEYNIIP